jgi:VWFA-related protein
MTLVHGGRVYNRLSLPAPVQEGIILPSSRPVDDTAGRIFILFVDDLHLVTSSTPKVRAVYKEIVDTLIHEGDMAGVISSGPSSLAIQMTYDRALIYAAGERLMGDGLSINETLLTQGGPRGPEELRFRAHVAMKTVRQVLKNLEQETNRRKVFLYLSNGYDFNPFPESRLFNGLLFGQRRRGQQALANDQINQDEFDQLYGGLPDPLTDPFEVQNRQGASFADADLGIDIAELARAANRANTSFYTIDPRGLVAGPGVDIEENIDISEWNSYIFKSQSSLRMLAELTGGMALVNRNDFGDALRQIDAETSDYYILGFYTSNPDPTFRTRTLDIEVVGRDDQSIDVDHRTHYTLPRGSA